CQDKTSLTWAPTNKDLYCCDNGSISCFDAKANPTASNCCGYALWRTCSGGSSPGTICGTNQDCPGSGTCTGIALPQGQATPDFAAATESGTWLDMAEPLEVQFKNACPTAYSYQYDDSTSTFVCGGVSSSNDASYAITFLPPPPRNVHGRFGRR